MGKQMKTALKYSIAAAIVSLPIVPFLDIVSFLFKSATEEVLVANTSKVIICIIFTLFVTGALQLMFKWAKMTDFAASIPGHMTAIGILGTFIGIFFGLYNFNTSDLSASVPILLEGMKLAFTTSIAGLASSTVLRITHTIVVSFSDEPDPWERIEEPDPVDTSSEIIEVDIPGYQEYSEASLGALFTVVNKMENLEKNIGSIRKSIEVIKNNVQENMRRGT